MDLKLLDTNVLNVKRVTSNSPSFQIQAGDSLTIQGQQVLLNGLVGVNTTTTPSTSLHVNANVGPITPNVSGASAVLQNEGTVTAPTMTITRFDDPPIVVFNMNTEQSLPNFIPAYNLTYTLYSVIDGGGGSYGYWDSQISSDLSSLGVGYRPILAWAQLSPAFGYVLERNFSAVGGLPQQYIGTTTYYEDTVDNNSSPWDSTVTLVSMYFDPPTNSIASEINPGSGQYSAGTFISYRIYGYNSVNTTDPSSSYTEATITISTDPSDVQLQWDTNGISPPNFYITREFNGENVFYTLVTPNNGNPSSYTDNNPSAWALGSAPPPFETTPYPDITQSLKYGIVYNGTSFDLEYAFYRRVTFDVPYDSSIPYIQPITINGMGSPEYYRVAITGYGMDLSATVGFDVHDPVNSPNVVRSLYNVTQTGDPIYDDGILTDTSSTVGFEKRKLLIQPQPVPLNLAAVENGGGSYNGFEQYTWALCSYVEDPYGNKYFSDPAVFGPYAFTGFGVSLDFTWDLDYSPNGRLYALQYVMFRTAQGGSSYDFVQFLGQTNSFVDLGTNYTNNTVYATSPPFGPYPVGAFSPFTSRNYTANVIRTSVSGGTYYGLPASYIVSGSAYHYIVKHQQSSVGLPTVYRGAPDGGSLSREYTASAFSPYYEYNTISVDGNTSMWPVASAGPKTPDHDGFTTTQLNRSYKVYAFKNSAYSLLPSTVSTVTQGAGVYKIVFLSWTSIPGASYKVTRSINGGAFNNSKTLGVGVISLYDTTSTPGWVAGTPVVTPTNSTDSYLLVDKAVTSAAGPHLVIRNKDSPAAMRMEFQSNLELPLLTLGVDALSNGFVQMSVGKALNYIGGPFGMQSGPQLTAATNITVTHPIHVVSGAGQIQNINVSNFTSGSVVLISLGGFSTNTFGNIARSFTSTVNRAIQFTYESTTAKWYPSQ